MRAQMNNTGTGNNGRKRMSECLDTYLQRKSINSNRFYIALTKANIELIWTESADGTDGYTNDIFQEVKQKTEWARQNRIFAAYYWRRSKEVNEIVYNKEGKIQPDSRGLTYPRRYYLRMVDNENPSNAVTRRAILNELCNFVNGKAKLRGSPNRLQSSAFIVPSDFDRTGPKTLAMDHYLLDEDIRSIISNCYIWQSEDWSSWGLQNNTEALTFFSQPYSEIAGSFGLN